MGSQKHAEKKEKFRGKKISPMRGFISKNRHGQRTNPGKEDYQSGGKGEGRAAAQVLPVIAF